MNKIPCITDSVQKGGCQLQDTACACREDLRQTLLDIAMPCLRSKCNEGEISQFQSAAQTLCNKVNG